MERKEIVVVDFWDSSKNECFQVTTDLESIIRSPNGHRMDQIGIVLLNIEREARGLRPYKLNTETGTYDET